MEPLTSGRLTPTIPHRKKWIEVQINAGVYVTTVDGAITISSDGSKTWKGEDGPDLVSESTPVRYVNSKDSPMYHFEDCSVDKADQAG